jgi:aminoglycoside phosphotransferase (APT) family kinase protein
MYEHLFAMMWDDFCAAARPFVPHAHLQAAEEVIGRFAAVCAEFAQAPRTLLHGDFRLDNLMLATDGTLAAIDWQLAAWGRGAYDLAFFAAGSIDDALLAELEPELLARYHRRLMANGVEHYDLARARRDYLGGLVMNLPNPVTALVAVPPGNERGAQLLRENARRALATVARHRTSLSSW